MTNVVANIPADVAASVSPETKQNFINQMVEAGHKRADVEAAFAKPVQRAPLDPNGKVFRTAAEADIAASAARQAAEDKIRANILEVTAPPEGGSYDLDWTGHRDLDIAELTQANAALTAAFAQAGLPAQLGRPMHSAMSDSVDAVLSLEGNEAGLQSWRQSQRVMLGRLPGGYEENLRLAGVFFARLPESVRNELVSIGAFDAFQSIMLAAHAGRAIEARESTA